MADQTETFDPDAYLAKKRASKSKASTEDFDPDAYLAKKRAQKEGSGDPEYDALMKGFAERDTFKAKARPWVETIPATLAAGGGMIGSTVGAPLMGVGAIPGGMLGAAAGGAVGSGIKNAIREYIYDEPIGTEEALVDPVLEASKGAAGEGAGVALGKGAQAAGRGLLKLSGELSSTPARAIETYSQRLPSVKALSKEHSGDIASAANAVRNKFDKSIRGFKDTQNRSIERALRESEGLADIDPVLTELDEATKGLDTIADKKALDEIAGLRSQVQDIIEESGGVEHVPLERLNSIKRMLQEATDFRSADSALSRNSKANAGIMRSASKANSLLRSAEPKVAEANKKLAQLHSITRKMNKNLISEGSPEGALVGAGAGNKRSIDTLKKLQDLTGEDFVGGADDLAAMHYLENAGILPSVMTGRSVAPLLMGGAGVLNELGQANFGGAAKAAAMGAVGSPLALKQALKLRYLMRQNPDLSREAIQALFGRVPVQVGRGLMED